MATITQALEGEVAAIRAICGSPAGGARARAARDAHFAALLRLIAPRIRHFIRQYGLGDHREDAEQACAIGAHRAVQLYDPAKARFTSFVNWQLRGELQGLRYRLRCEARDDAGVVTAICPALVDEEAIERTEAAAARRMARHAGEAMLEDYLGQLRALGLRHLKGRGRTAAGARARLEARLARERAVVERLLFGDDEDAAAVPGPRRTLGNERQRQLARRALSNLANHVRGDPRFDPDADPAQS